MKLNNVLVVVVILVVALLAGWYLLRNNSNTAFQTDQPNQTNQQTPTSATTSSIQNDTDLTNASSDLDKIDVDGTVDPQLNQNDTDAQTFAPRIRLKNGTSLNWAGYAVETNLTNPANSAVSDVKGNWVVPTVSCAGVTINTYSATWIGIDGYSDNSVEQTGTEQDCINGQPAYYAWYEMYPKPSHRISLSVTPGHTMSAEVVYSGKNKFVITLTDTTTGKLFTTTQSANAQRQSAEWIMEAPWSGGTLPLANFGTQVFSSAGATLNGHPGTISDPAWQNDGITMTTSSGTAKATPSSLSTDGRSFSVNWYSN